MKYARDSKFLPGLGWDCPNPACGVFNGDLKEERTTCRSCDTPRPGTSAEILTRSVDDLEVSVRLANFLQESGCKTVAQADELQRDESKWFLRRKILKELREVLKNIGVLT